jgi:hypothetical protein
VADSLSDSLTGVLRVPKDALTGRHTVSRVALVHGLFSDPFRS